MKLEIVSANRLIDGRVVYLARDGGWSESIVDGRTARDEEESTALLAEAEHAAALETSGVRRSRSKPGSPLTARRC